MSRHEEEEGPGHERWLVSYADFITLMFAFFTVLYATSEKDVEKSREFQESIKKYLIKAGGMGAMGPQFQQEQRGNTVIESPITTHTKAKPESVAVLDQAETFLESNITKEERRKFVADLSADEWGVRLVIPASALYATGSEKFRGEALPFIDKLSQLLASTKRKVLIEGHVAPGEVGGTRSTWDFASARAVNLLRYMQKKEGIPAARLAVASLADSRPAFSGENAQLNSRIELVLLDEDTSF